MNSGKDFEYEISKSLRYYNEKINHLWFLKIPDATSYQSHKYRPVVPFDFIALHEGIVYGLEAKSSRNKTSYNFDYIAEHQIYNVLMVDQLGGIGRFLINNRSRPRDFRMYSISAQQIIKWTEVDCRKSIKWIELDGMCETLEITKIPRMRDGMWDFRELFLV